MDELMKLDLYDILGVLPSAEKKEIVKSYRKKALKCHPDKNPDNPKAADLFHQLSKALEILTDEAARSAYDKILKSKKAAEIRHKELDGKRKKFKEDLEARERAAAENRAQKRVPEVDAAEKLRKEIERLRKEGSRLLEEEQQRLKKEVQENTDGTNTPVEEEAAGAPRLKLKWKAKKGDETNGGYSHDFLHKAFSKYGEISALLISGKKKGSAVLEYENAHSAVQAVQNEIGLPENPLSIAWLSGQPASEPQHHNSSSAATQGGVSGFSFSGTEDGGQPPASSERDFENLVLMKMRQAQERKRLAEEMLREDEQEGKT